MNKRTAARFGPRPMWPTTITTRKRPGAPVPMPQIGLSDVQGLTARVLHKIGLVLVSAAFLLAACAWYAAGWQWFVVGLGLGARAITLGHAFGLFALLLDRKFPPLFVRSWPEAGDLLGQWATRYALLGAAHWLVELGG